MLRCSIPNMKRAPLTDALRWARCEKAWSLHGLAPHHLPLDPSLYEDPRSPFVKTLQESIASKGAQQVFCAQPVAPLGGTGTAPIPQHVQGSGDALSKTPGAPFSIAVVPVSNSGVWPKRGKLLQEVAAMSNAKQIYETSKRLRLLSMGSAHCVLTPKLPQGVPSPVDAIVLVVVQRSSTKMPTSGGEVSVRATRLALTRVARLLRIATLPMDVNVVSWKFIPGKASSIFERHVLASDAFKTSQVQTLRVFGTTKRSTQRQH